MQTSPNYIIHVHSIRLNTVALPCTLISISTWGLGQNSAGCIGIQHSAITATVDSWNPFKWQ